MVQSEPSRFIRGVIRPSRSSYARRRLLKGGRTYRLTQVSHEPRAPSLLSFLVSLCNDHATIHSQGDISACQARAKSMFCRCRKPWSQALTAALLAGCAVRVAMIHLTISPETPNLVKDGPICSSVEAITAHLKRRTGRCPVPVACSLFSGTAPLRPCASRHRWRRSLVRKGPAADGYREMVPQ